MTLSVETELASEFRISQISLVVDLHLFVLVDASHAAGLEILESELSLHGRARVGSVADEARLAECARVIASRLEIVNDVARSITKLSNKLFKGGGSLAEFDQFNTGSFDLGDHPSVIFVGNLGKGTLHILTHVRLIDHYYATFFSFS